MKKVIIIGSSRSNGNTKRIVDKICKYTSPIDVIDISEKYISPYRYDYKSSNDDFLSIMQCIVKCDLVIFATPVYWYSMSGLLKNFFDRFTDLLKFEKKLGRNLKNIKMASVSCGYDRDLVEGFIVPFQNTASYLGMEHVGHLHTYIRKDNKIYKKVDRDILKFSSKLNTL